MNIEKGTTYQLVKNFQTGNRTFETGELFKAEYICGSYLFKPLNQTGSWGYIDTDEIPDGCLVKYDPNAVIGGWERKAKATVGKIIELLKEIA